MKRRFALMLAAILVVSLTACGGGVSQKDMADAVVKATVEATADKGEIYGSDELSFAGDNYVKMVFYYIENEEPVRFVSVALFDGKNIDDFAVSAIDSDAYDALSEAMDGAGKLTNAKADLISEVLEANDIKDENQIYSDILS